MSAQRKDLSSTLIEQVIDLAQMPAAALPEAALALARLSLFDWLVCLRAGVNEPLGVILRNMVAAEGGRAEASVAAGARAPARAAALVNGAIGHALDYDDTHFAHVGHPSAAIYPAALAAAELNDAPAEAVCTAYLVGAEAAIRIGCVLGASHYDRGFHQTSTAGAFGATIAAARLLRLTRAQLRAAIGLCATRASGLRSQFGTMGKPYNAGIAAATGVEVALLARMGFSSADDGLMGPQGFVATHSDDPQPPVVPSGGFLFEDIKYKLHACCHGTHAMIEALLELRAAHDLQPGQVARIHLRTSPRWLSVCNIPAPRTGLEVKFSYAWLAAMVLAGRATQDSRLFTDALAADPDLASLAARVEVTGAGELTEMQAAGEVLLEDGRRLNFAHDLAAKQSVAALRSRLADKAHACVGAEARRMLAMLDRLDEMSARELGRLLNPPAGPSEG